MTTISNAERGVIFDLDGVLIDSAEPHFQSWCRLADELGAKITRDQFHATFGRQNRDIIPELFLVSEPARVAALADRKEAIYRDIIRRNPPVIEGAVDLVEGLAELGVALAIGSSAPRTNIVLILEAMGIERCFDAVISGDDVTRGKPDPEVFQRACDGLGLPPSRCVVIEDAPAGVQAALAAGAAAVAVLIHHDKDAFDGAACCVEKLAYLTPERLLGLL